MVGTSQGAGYVQTESGSVGVATSWTGHGGVTEHEDIILTHPAICVEDNDGTSTVADMQDLILTPDQAIHLATILLVAVRHFRFEGAHIESHP